MKRLKETARSPTAPLLALNSIEARGSPGKRSGAQRVVLTSVKRAAVIPTSDVEPGRDLDPGDVDERQLLCAIHVLDDSSKPSKGLGGSGVDNLRAVRRALGFMVELTSSIDGERAAKAGEKATQAGGKATICAARVLGCLKRFVASNKHIRDLVDPADGAPERSVAHSCELKRHWSLVRLAVLLVLFHLSRSRQTAPAVLAEGLDAFLFEMAQCSGTAQPSDRLDHRPCLDAVTTTSGDGSCEPSQAIARSAAEPQLGLLQAEDVLVAVDPFDWCCEALSIDLALGAAGQSPSRLDTRRSDTLFLLPLGSRTLSCLLDGTAIPTDEVQEHARRLERPPVRCRHCSHSSRTLKSLRKQKPRWLPSIFSFPSGNDGVDAGSARGHCCGQRTSQASTDTLTDRAWAVAMSAEARVHLALRSLVALALRVPEHSSERRALTLRWRSQALGEQTKNSRDSFHPVGRMDDESSSGDELQDGQEQYSESLPPSLPPHQAVAVSTYVLSRLAEMAQLVLSRVDSQETNVPTRGYPRSSKRPRDMTGTKRRTSAVEHAKPLSVRLITAKANAQHELALWEVEAAESDASRACSERRHRRHSIRQSIARLEHLRRSLAQGFEILRTGRTHSDPTQSFSDWIRSLPTVESHERERQAEKEARQRLELERRYLVDARRRREQEERVLMTANDCDVSNDMEISAQADKQARFLEMRTELRSLEDALDSADAGVAGMSYIRTSGSSPAARGLPARLDREHEKHVARQQRERLERERLQQLRQQEREARECAQMRVEDVFFAVRALRQQEHARRQREDKAAQLQAARARALELQQQKIAEMRTKELDARRAEQEAERMRVEDLFSRQRRFFQAEQAKLERQREQAARKRMQTEEQDSRWRWQLIGRAAVQQEAAEQKRQRAEERRARRQKQQLQMQTSSQIVAAEAGDWVQCWDEGGNAYYYNSRTGVSQWEAPASG